MIVYFVKNLMLFELGLANFFLLDSKKNYGSEFDLILQCCVRIEEILRFLKLGFDCNEK